MASGRRRRRPRPNGSGGAPHEPAPGRPKRVRSPSGGRHRWRQGGRMTWPKTRGAWAAWILIGVPLLVFSVWAIAENAKLYFTTLLNSLTLASLYFLVASGFTLVFGLMRNVNLAHGSLYLMGAYV